MQECEVLHAEVSHTQESEYTDWQQRFPRSNDFLLNSPYVLRISLPRTHSLCFTLSPHLIGLP